MRQYWRLVSLDPCTGRFIVVTYDHEDQVRRRVERGDLDSLLTVWFAAEAHQALDEMERRAREFLRHKME